VSDSIEKHELADAAPRKVNSGFLGEEQIVDGYNRSRLTRRTFGALTAGGAASFVIPPWIGAANAALASSNTVAWHDRTAAQHKALLDNWAAKGFRTLSLSIYGSTQNPLFAAVLVKRPNVIATRQVFDLTQAQMQRAFDDQANLGFGPYILTATGPGNSAKFAAVFTPRSPIPLTRLNLTGEQFNELTNQQLAAGQILVWADAFGTPDDTRYTAIWGPNPSRQAWNCEAIDEDAASLQARFSALTDAWARPTHISVTPAGRHLEMFVDSTIGPWSSRVGMTSAEYQQEYTARTAQGLQPVRVSASGEGADRRFAAIFASREEPHERTFRAKGPVTVAAIDSAIEAYVKDHDLRGAALAVVQGTRLVYAKGYTWAEPSPIYPDVLATTLFRLASVSKSFAAIAMWRLFQLQPNITLDTRLQSVLNLKQPNGSPPKDSRFAAIRLRHLLESTSGLPQSLLYHSKNAAAAAGASLPATQLQLARYGCGFDLSADPGSTMNVVYGNFDYFLLSQVIAKLANTSSFEQALQQLVGTPLGLTRTRGSRSLVGAQAADEARHHLRVYSTEGWALTPLQVGASVRNSDERTVAAQYGALDYEMFDGCGGVSSAVVDVARLGAMLSARQGNPVLTAASIDAHFTNAANATSNLSSPPGGSAHGYHGWDWAKIDDMAAPTYRCSKGGWLPGLSSGIRITTGGLTYVILRNGDPRKGVATKWLEPIQPICEAHDWGTSDLFPQFGMPSLGTFQISSQILSALPAMFSVPATEQRVMDSMARSRPPEHQLLPRPARVQSVPR
jgi:CubicO group peptidase (beta-lactamase class C family)